ncbi:Molybdenum cofactor biosynthesis enzyme [uncultured Candidatus Thioglobus sp.]|nr:Molybdenum cofactor biosynthesis enzyme [uncultured Candidatus Thioglobus sp.]
MKKEKIVINWHLLEPCQLKCKYCYAEWSRDSLPIIYKKKFESEQLIMEILTLKESYKSVRLSFAGGEPLLDNKLSNKIDFARQIGLKVSIITNGDLLTEEFLRDNALKIDMLGVSIDSFSKITNLNIGRATLLGRVPDYQKIIALLGLAKDINPDIEIKINTVVNQFNFNEDMNSAIKSINPTKWKIFRVLPSTEKAKTQEISDKQFGTFIDKHQHNEFCTVEDNDDMFNSYLMIDPYGRFFYNKENYGYDYSPNILDIGMAAALKDIDFKYEKFENRY